MGITKIHAIKSTLSKAILYIENPDKTAGQELVSAYNNEPQTASFDFAITAAMAHKARSFQNRKPGNLAYHLIQSFSPGDAVTPELAHELGRKLAMEFTEGKFEFVVATHIDKDSIHNHIIINAVSFYDYKKLRTVPYRTAQQIRSISDRLCMEAQLSVIEDPQKLGQLYPTYVQKKRATSNRTEVRKKLNFCLERATNYAQFLQMAQELGISVCQRGKHITYLLEGAGRAIRDTSLADTDKFTYAGLMECLEDNAAEQLFIRERIAKILPNVSTFADFAKLLQSEGVKIRVKKQSRQLLYKAVNLDGTWIPADALGDGFTLGGLEISMKSGFEGLDEGHGTPIADLYRELTTEYPQNCDTPIRLTARQICSAGKRGVLLQIQDANGNPAKLMMDNRHIHTTSDGAVTADIGAAFSYDITYDDGTHGTIRGTDLIRQIDEANLTQPLTVSLTANQIIAMSLRGVTVHLPQYGIERLFIPEHYVQRNVEQGSCTISLYPGWQYSYVPTGSEKTRKSISGADLAQSLGCVVQVDTFESSLARRVANVERRAGIANAQELGKLLGSMAANGLHSAADFDKQINAYRREEMKLRNEIAELRSKSKTYAATAHNLQVCRTYKSVWLEYASQPLSKKGAFYKQNEAALQTYSRATSQLDKMGISQLVEPEKLQRLVLETEKRIAELDVESEKVKKVYKAVQEDKETVKQIQYDEIQNKYNCFSSSTL
ncbi:relaxase/mobilization nuclease domain-containing protein [Gemmiger formicilis]|uniref:relaxase/mobilization nuclease domain-containing protein n=1 Tax=Gemmiger formicilis TaxID=745368 RepID=UPI0032BF5061